MAKNKTPVEKMIDAKESIADFREKIRKGGKPSRKTYDTEMTI